MIKNDKAKGGYLVVAIILESPERTRRIRDAGEKRYRHSSNFLPEQTIVAA
jgi:hypothetical protein